MGLFCQFFFQSPAAPVVPCEPWLQPLCKREAALNNQKLHFLAAAPAFDNFATARQVAGFDYGPFWEQHAVI